MMVEMIGFGTLAVFVLAGLAGPLLGLSRRWFVPLVVGEILAGMLVGPEVIGAVDPHAPTISFLGEVGFAMLMLSVGMHLPLRDRRLRSSLGTGARLAGIVAVLAIPAGLLASAARGQLARRRVRARARFRLGRRAAARAAGGGRRRARSRCP